MTFAASLLSVLAAFLLATTTGYALIRLCAEGLSRPEKVAWSVAAGLFAQSLLFVICILVSPGCGPVPVFVLDLLIVASSFLVRRPGRPAPLRVRSLLVPALLLLVAGAAWLVFLVEALGEPMWSTDYLAMWGLKGKTVFELGSVPIRLFQDPALYWAHREYPLLVPLSLAMLASFAGAWDDQALALLFPFCELATLLALFGFLARRVSIVAGATAAALASLDVFLYRAVNAGTAEVPLALSLVLVSCAFLDVRDGPSRPAIARLFAASLLCVSTKQEGTLFVVLLAALMWPRRRRAVWALVVPPVVHWALLYALRGPQTRRDFDLTLFMPRRWMELPPLFAKVMGRILGTEAVLAWVPLLAIVVFLVVTRRGIADPLLPVFLLQVLCYAVAFSVSSFDPMYAVDGAFRRIALTLFPAFALILGARLTSSGERLVSEKAE